MRVITSDKLGLLIAGTGLAALIHCGGNAGHAPKLRSHLPDQTITEGQQVTFSIAAKATPTPTYQWLKNGQPITNATGSSFTFTASREDNDSEIQVIVKNSCGETPSNKAALIVVSKGGIPPKQPDSSKPQLRLLLKADKNPIKAGDNAELTATLESGPSTAITYQWIRVYGDSHKALDGVEGPIYSIRNAEPWQEGTYYVVAMSNGQVIATSERLEFKLTDKDFAPVFVTPPANVEAFAGDSVTLKAQAKAYPAPEYQWFRKSGRSDVKIPGATWAEYVIPCVDPVKDNGAEFYVTAANTLGMAKSNPAKLTVKQKTFTVKFVAGPNGTVEGKLEQQVEWGGSTEEMTAKPNEKFRLKHWTSQNCKGFKSQAGSKYEQNKVVDDLKFTLEKVTCDCIITAEFFQRGNPNDPKDLHGLHNMTTYGVGCNDCHPNMNRRIVNIKPLYRTKAAPPYDPKSNDEDKSCYNYKYRTCVNVSCHGGQETPGWYDAPNVQNNCTKCHAPQAADPAKDEYLSYGGDHKDHSRYACSVCHDFQKLNGYVLDAEGKPTKKKVHFGDMKDHKLKGNAAKTIGGSNKSYTVENGVGSCVTACHGPSPLPWKKKKQ